MRFVDSLLIGCALMAALISINSENEAISAAWALFAGINLTMGLWRARKA